MRLKGVLQPLRDDSTFNEIITSINNKFNGMKSVIK